MEGLKKVAAESLKNIMEANIEYREDGDYIGEDGLLYCGKCRTPKQTRVKIPVGIFGNEPTERIVPCVCKCRMESEERRKREEKYREEMARIQRMKDASMMDKKFRDARFSSYQVTPQNKKVYDLARKYADNFDSMYQDSQGIIFYGPVGTGKSHTAACIANALLERQTSVIMTSFVKILQNLQSRDEAEYIAMLNSAKLLILDDLGTERNTDYSLEKVYNIVDSRSRAAKPMILTTNLPLDEMLEAVDIRYKRIYDRIFETCFPVEVPGESFRRISAEQRFDKMAKFMEG